MEKLIIKITQSQKEQLIKYANKYYDGNMLKTIREFVDKGLSINSYKDDISFIRNMIYEELESTLKLYMERLVAISVKSGVVSASSHFTLAEVLAKLVEPRYRRVLEEVL